MTHRRRTRAEARSVATAVTGAAEAGQHLAARMGAPGRAGVAT